MGSIPSTCSPLAEQRNRQGTEVLTCPRPYSQIESHQSDKDVMEIGGALLKWVTLHILSVFWFIWVNGMGLLLCSIQVQHGSQMEVYLTWRVSLPVE